MTRYRYLVPMDADGMEAHPPSYMGSLLCVCLGGHKQRASRDDHLERFDGVPILACYS